MACAKPSDCAPCSKCPDSSAPVMPRCDIVLDDGSYANATVVVEGGCVISVTQGVPLVYQPDNNCAPSGTTGDVGGGLQGDPGDAGEAATIQIGTVTSLTAGAAPTFENVGTPNHAIFNIGIPRGVAGADASLPTNGADSNTAGINLVNGMILEPLPPMWPPLLDVLVLPVMGTGVVLEMVKDAANGLLSVSLDVTSLINWMSNELANKQEAIDAQQLQINDLLTRMATQEARP